MAESERKQYRELRVLEGNALQDASLSPAENISRCADVLDFLGGVLIPPGPDDLLSLSVSESAGLTWILNFTTSAIRENLIQLEKPKHGEVES